MADINQLKLEAARCRMNVLRMLRSSGAGHVGGALSAMDIVTALYFYKMHASAGAPKDPARDRFILSAGHKCLCQYAALAERRYFSKEIFDTYGKLRSVIPGHPDMKKLPGVEANTGALGHGLAIADGMALSLRMDYPSAKVYVVMGDGELAEGSNWEAAAVAAHYGLDNVILIVDFNTLQISGRVKDVMNFTPVSERFAAFGWAVRDIDGNNMQEIVSALDAVPFEAGKPTCIVAHTVKCKGLPFGEDDVAYHYWKPTPEQLDEAEGIVGESIKELEKIVEGGLA